jgi:hypothetical protein
MSWIVGIALAALAIYLVFFRKPKSNEIVIRVEASIANNVPEADSVVGGDEEKDNWERFDFYGARMLPARGRYRINYEDQRGLKTERDIEVKRVHENAEKYAIDAHCLLRNAHRSFLGERILKAINLDTGEIVEDLARDAMAQYNDSGEGRALAAIDKEWMGVAVLVFVCRADGQMRKAERAIVAEYLKRHCTEMPLNDTELDSAIKSIGEPDHREFKRIIRDLKTAGERARLSDLLDCAKQIVGTQKTIAPMEKAALEILTEATT